jgi:hypothetical protein
MEYCKEKDGYKYYYDVTIAKDKLMDLKRELNTHYCNYSKEINDFSNNLNYANYSCPQLNTIIDLLLTDDEAGLRKLATIGVAKIDPVAALIKKQHDYVLAIEKHNQPTVYLNQLLAIKNNIAWLSQNNQMELAYLSNIIEAMRLSVTMKFISREAIPALVYKR